MAYLYNHTICQHTVIMRWLQEEKNKATEKILDAQHEETSPEKVVKSCKVLKRKEQRAMTKLYLSLKDIILRRFEKI